MPYLTYFTFMVIGKEKATGPGGPVLIELVIFITDRTLYWYGVSNM